MMRLIDGPGAGKVLAIRRAPIVLRVVNAGHDWDALDQLDDTPRPDEKLYLYILNKRPGAMHVCTRPRRGGGMYPFGEYRYLTDQPEEATMRDPEKWARWCQDNRERLTPEWAKEC